MTPQNNEMPYDAKTHVDNSLSVTQKGEVLICEVKRHPIGIIIVYVISVLVLLLVAVVIYGASHIGNAVSSSQANQIGGVVLLILATIAVVYSLIATKVYWSNNWVVTSDSLTQISQSSLFNRQSSQLSLHSLEDVTVEQNGILTHIFNYGVLRAETAGERSKFMFTFCPNPNFYAQQILAAHEAFEQRQMLAEAHAEQTFSKEPAQYPAPQSVPSNPQLLQPPRGGAYDHGVDTPTKQV